MNRLNGWQRLYVVCAGVGLLCAILYGLKIGAESYDVDYDVAHEFGRPECKTIIEMPAQTRLNPEPSSDDPCWNLYLYRSIYEGAKQTEADYVKHMKAKQRESIYEAIGVIALVWLILAALTYFAGNIVAWVIKGFRNGGKA